MYVPVHNIATIGTRWKLTKILSYEITSWTKFMQTEITRITVNSIITSFRELTLTFSWWLHRVPVAGMSSHHTEPRKWRGSCPVGRHLLPAHSAPCQGLWTYSKEGEGEGVHRHGNTPHQTLGSEAKKEYTHVLYIFRVSLALTLGHYDIIITCLAPLLKSTFCIIIFYIKLEASGVNIWVEQWGCKLVQGE